MPRNRELPNHNRTYSDAAALARWIDEGGAVALVLDQTDRRAPIRAKAGVKVTVVQESQDALVVGPERGSRTFRSGSGNAVGQNSGKTAKRAG
jgi:hypothetical protein